MKQLRIFISVLLLMAMAQSIWAQDDVSVGSQFTASEDGNTYVYRDLSDKTNFKVGLVTCVATGDVTLPETLTDNLGNHCTVTRFEGTFKTPSAVTGLTFPPTITTLEHNNVISNTKITDLFIPSWVTNVNAQQNAYITYTVDDNNPVYKDVDGVLYKKSGETNLILYHYPKGKAKNDDLTFSVPENVISIEYPGFFQISNIKKLIVPKATKSIAITPSNALGSIYDLTEIEVHEDNPVYYSPEGVLCKKEEKTLEFFPRAKNPENGIYTVPEPIETIKTGAFNTNSNVKEIILSNSVTTLESNCFVSLSNLTTLTISANVDDITSGNPFSNCTKFAEYKVDEGNDTYTAINGVLFTKDETGLISYPYNHKDKANYIVPEGTVYIGNGAFQSTLIQKVTVPTSVTTIRANAFQVSQLNTLIFDDIENSQCTTFGTSAFYKTKLTSFVCPPKLTAIPYGCFDTIRTLETIELNEGLKSIAQYAFKSCPKLEEITIPKTVNTLGWFAFELSGLKKVTFEEGSAITALNQTFQNCRSLEEINLEVCENLTTIGGNAFKNCYKLKPITIPAKVSTIGSNAFVNCRDLTTVYFEGGEALKTIGSHAFANSGLQEIALPESVTKIDRLAFFNCDDLLTVDIPAATTTIDPEAFQFCENLLEINVDEDNPKYASADGFLVNKTKTELVIFPCGKTHDHFIVLPPSLTSIGQMAFYYCENLENVTIPKHVQKIGYHAFYLCI